MADITSIQAQLAQLRRQPLDLRLEVVLAELLDYGYVFDDFLLQPVGLFARRYRRDIGNVREELFERSYRRVTRTVIETHREGLYDALPQQVFHQPGSSGPGSSSGVRSMVEDIRTQRQREKSTRQFFLPFEQEFFRLRVRIEQEERLYFTNLSAEWYNEAMAQFWGITNANLPAIALNNLLYLLPLAHSIVGDLSRTQQCFESVLGQSVRLRLVSPLRYTLPGASPETTTADASSGMLGSLRLGQDLVLGGYYQETLPTLEILLQELTTAELEDYLTDAWPARALALLCEYFVAFETDIVIRYDMAVEKATFRLGEGEDAAVLGFTTAGI